MDDDVINQLLLSRAIPSVSFNFIACEELEIPGGLGKELSFLLSLAVAKLQG